jgi:hypothetical protein
MSARKEEIKINENIAVNELKIQLNLAQTTIISMKEQITP